jgi:hypothetical protein
MKVYHGYRRADGLPIIETLHEAGEALIKIHPLHDKINLSVSGFDWVKNGENLSFLILRDATGDEVLAGKYKHKFCDIVIYSLNPIEWHLTQKQVLEELKKIIAGSKVTQVECQVYLSPTILQQRFEAILYKAGFVAILSDSELDSIDKSKGRIKWLGKYHLFIKHIGDSFYLGAISQLGDSRVYISISPIKDLNDVTWDAFTSEDKLTTSLKNQRLL